MGYRGVVKGKVIVLDEKVNLQEGTLVEVTPVKELPGGSPGALLEVWGSDVPEALLIFALIIVLSGILLGTKFAFLSTISIGIILIGLTNFHSNHAISFESSWKAQQTGWQSCFQKNNLACLPKRRWKHRQPAGIE